MDVEITPLSRKHMKAAERVENAASGVPWTHENFLQFHRQRTALSVVALYRGEVVGHLLYNVCPDALCLANMAVEPTFQRQQVGTQLVNHLKSKLRRYAAYMHILTVVHERNLDAQLFYKAQGFLAIHVAREFFDTGESAYEMRYTVAAAVPHNRLTQYSGR